MPNWTQYDLERQQARARSLDVHRDGPTTPDAVPAGGEGKLHDDIITWLKQKRWRYCHFPMGKPAAVSDQPDFVIWADEGRVLNVECKTRTGVLTHGRLRWRMQVETNGHDYYVVRSMREFMEVLR